MYRLFTFAPIMGKENAAAIIELYQNWLDAWNARNATGMTDLFAVNGNLIGFDGSQIIGKVELLDVLDNVFAHHPTAAYVALIREVRLLSPGVAWLKADAGMIPHGKSDINPALNAVQTMVAVNEDESWKISVFQNTPAAFHALPELAERMTADLREVLKGDN